MQHRYRLTLGAGGRWRAEPFRGTLYLALRPFQVNPPAQFLNTTGGFAPIHRLERSGQVIKIPTERLYAVDGTPREQFVPKQGQ